MRVRPLAWSDFSGWVDLYYSRYDEVGRNPDLGVYLQEKRPSVPEEAALFGQVMKQVLAGDIVASVAEEEGKLVGTCTVFRRGHHVEDCHLGELAIAVHPEWRGKGVGDALMSDALRRCRGVFEIVELKVVAVNEHALHLYRKHGFEVHGRQPRAFKRGDRYLDDVLMWRAIEPATSDAPPG
jgi:ribosomal protein S18 acetylase RimI-like enzyme